MPAGRKPPGNSASQRNTAREGARPVLQDTPVLRTDQPFTVAAWVRLDQSAGEQTIVPQETAGAGSSGFNLVHRGSDNTWVFSVRGHPTTTAHASVAVAAEEPTGWHHLVAVFAPGRDELRLHVD